MSIQRQSGVNPVSSHSQSNVNPLSIQCQCSADMMPIRCQSSPNPVSIRCQSASQGDNSVRRRGTSLLYGPATGLDGGRIGHRFSTKKNVNMTIQCRYSNPMSIHYQSVNPTFVDYLHHPSPNAPATHLQAPTIKTGLTRIDTATSIMRHRRTTP